MQEIRLGTIGSGVIVHNILDAVPMTYLPNYEVTEVLVVSA